MRNGRSGCSTRLSIEAEDHEHHDTGHEAADGDGVAPAVAAGPREAVDDAEQTQGAGDGAGQVELAGVRLGLVEEAGRQERRGEADRDVDQEGEAPAVDREAEDVRGGAGEPAAEDQADCSAGAGHGGVDREGPVAGRARGERRGDQGERGGGGERGAEALEPTGAEEQGLVGREATQERRHGEDREADHEDLAAAVEVAEPPTEQQQAAEGQGVAGDDPGEVGVADPQVDLDVGERDVGDARVEHDHQLRDRDQDQGPGEVELALRRCHRLGRRRGAGDVGHGVPSGGRVTYEWIRGVRHCGRTVVTRWSVRGQGVVRDGQGVVEEAGPWSAAGRTTSSRICPMSSGVMASPSRKLRCMTIAVSEGARTERSVSGWTSPRARARS